MKTPRSLYFIRTRKKVDGVLNQLHSYVECDNIPETAGVYIIVSTSESFQYARKKSKIIYIGMSTNLKKRIKGHVSHFNTLMKIPIGHRRFFWYYSRYNYMVNHGCKLFWLSIRGGQHPKDLESGILEEFYNEFHCLPVGNGAFSFPRY